MVARLPSRQPTRRTARACSGWRCFSRAAAARPHARPAARLRAQRRLPGAAARRSASWRWRSPGCSCCAELGVALPAGRRRALPRRSSPALNPDTALHAGDPPAATTRSATAASSRMLLQGEAAARWARVSLHACDAAGRSRASSRRGADGVAAIAPAGRRRRARGQRSFDAVVVCAGVGSAALLRPLGLQLPLAPVYGYSVTAPLRHVESHPDLRPALGA